MTHWIAHLAQRRRHIIAAFVLTFACIAWFRAVGAQLERSIGVPPFDLQTPLALEAMTTQIPRYTSEAKSIYLHFVVADTAFPLVAGLLFTLVFARSLITLNTPFANRLLRSPILLWPMLIAVLDWLENLFFVLAIWSGNPQTPWAVVATTTKAVKVAFLPVFSVGVYGFALFVLARHLAGRSRRHQQV